MLTDAPPRKANRAQFLESDQMKTLDLPKNGRLPSITKSIESEFFPSHTTPNAATIGCKRGTGFPSTGAGSIPAVKRGIIDANLAC